MTMKILITGGAGCIGANLIDHWTALGQRPDILVIDHFATSARVALPANHEGLTVLEGSIADRDLVMRAFESFAPSHVLHAAAAYKDPDNYGEDGRTNVYGTGHVIEASLATGVERFVNLQTALCYGRPDTVPIPIDAPLRPFTSYGVSKTAGEMMVLESGLNAVSLRLANITGPRLSIGPIPTFYTRLLAGKSCFCSDTVRDFLDMSDFLSLLDLSMKIDAPKGVYNVSTGVGSSINEVFDIIAKLIDKVPSEPVPIVPAQADDVARVVLDPSKTETEFAWKAKVSLEESLSRMVNWYNINGVRAVYAHLKAPKGHNS